MKISLIMTGAGAGGVQQSLVTYAKSLSRHHDVQTIVWRNSPVIPQLEEHRIKFETVAFSSGKYMCNFLQVFQLRALLKRFSPDVAIGFSPRGYRETRDASRHAPWTLVARIGSMLASRIRPTLGADAWIANSREMAAYLQTLGCREERVMVVENFLNSERSLRPSRKKTGPARIGAAGRLVKRKGFSTLVKAAKILSDRGHDIVWKIAGDGPELSSLQKEATQLDIEHAVSFLGWLDSGQKKKFYGEIDLFVCPSIDDPFPRVMLEAAQLGIPMVATDFVGSRAVFTDRKDALIAKGNDAAGVADAIEELLLKPELAETLAENAGKLFENHYSLSAGEKRICNVASALHGLNARG